MKFDRKPITGKTDSTTIFNEGYNSAIDMVNKALAERKALKRETKDLRERGVFKGEIRIPNLQNITNDPRNQFPQNHPVEPTNEYLAKWISKLEKQETDGFDSLNIRMDKLEKLQKSDISEIMDYIHEYVDAHTKSCIKDGDKIKLDVDTGNKISHFIQDAQIHKFDGK